jgi:dTMP kinase
MAHSKGLFITFEGIDGVGKTEAVIAFTKHVSQTRNVIATKTPGDIINGELVGSAIGPVIRSVLFTDKYPYLSYETKSLLLLADHMDMLYTCVKPAIENGIIVISDRYIDSQLAYWDKPEEDPIKQTFRRLYTVKPDITFLLLGNPRICLGRALARSPKESAKQSNKIWNTVEEFTRIQEAYITELTPESRTIPILTNGLDAEQVNRRIVTRFNEWLERNKVDSSVSLSQ